MSKITINANDNITDSRSDINSNFTELYDGKEDVSNKDTDTSLSSNSDTKYPSVKAVKAYIDTSGGANASETVRGIVEEATDAEVTAGTATGATGAKLFITPSKLATRLSATALNPIRRVYLNADSPATWSKPTGLKYIDVEVIGGGGGGGGSGTTNNHAGGGGGGGGYSRKMVAVAALGATETVTIGAGGAGGSSGAGNGSAGSTSSFGSHCSATGGAGGNYGNQGTPGAIGGVGSSGDINVKGGGGEVCSLGVAGVSSGRGGSSVLGGGAEDVSDERAGIAGGVYGGGGSGGLRVSSNTGGGNGGNGIVIVMEHYI